MEDLNAAKQRTHKLLLTNRRTCTISGVCDVLSFDVKEVLLETDQGMLMIKGEDLHVSRLTLDKGEVDVDGKIDSFTYSEVTGYGNKGNPCFPGFLSRWQMSQDIVNEVYFLAYSVIMGIAITFVYDFILIGRKIIRHNLFFISLEDFYFGQLVRWQYFICCIKRTMGF